MWFVLLVAYNIAARCFGNTRTCVISLIREREIEDTAFEYAILVVSESLTVALRAVLDVLTSVFILEMILWAMGTTIFDTKMLPVWIWLTDTCIKILIRIIHES